MVVLRYNILHINLSGFTWSFNSLFFLGILFIQLIKDLFKNLIDGILVPLHPLLLKNPLGY